MQATHRINAHHGAAPGCRSWRPCPVSELSSAAQLGRSTAGSPPSNLAVGKHTAAAPASPPSPCLLPGSGERPARPGRPLLHVQVSVSLRDGATACRAARQHQGGRPSPAERMSHRREPSTPNKQPAVAAPGPLPGGAAPGRRRGCGAPGGARGGGRGRRCGAVEWWNGGERVREREREKGGGDGFICSSQSG